MPLTASNDRILWVHQELGQILDDLGLAARLPQALLDRLTVLRRTLLQELNASAADSDEDSLSAVALCGASEANEYRAAAVPVFAVPDSKYDEEDALLRLDDDGGANSRAQHLRT